jgi:hypothetical protein
MAACIVSFRIDRPDESTGRMLRYSKDTGIMDAGAYVIVVGRPRANKLPAGYFDFPAEGHMEWI